LYLGAEARRSVDSQDALHGTRCIIPPDSRLACLNTPSEDKKPWTFRLVLEQRKMSVAIDHLPWFDRNPEHANVKRPSASNLACSSPARN
jgi:hypothetical protein